MLQWHTRRLCCEDELFHAMGTISILGSFPECDFVKSSFWNTWRTDQHSQDRYEICVYFVLFVLLFKSTTFNILNKFIWVSWKQTQNERIISIWRFWLAQKKKRNEQKFHFIQFTKKTFWNSVHLHIKTESWLLK